MWPGCREQVPDPSSSWLQDAWSGNISGQYLKTPKLLPKNVRCFMVCLLPPPAAVLSLYQPLTHEHVSNGHWGELTHCLWHPALCRLPAFFHARTHQVSSTEAESHKCWKNWIFHCVAFYHTLLYTITLTLYKYIVVIIIVVIIILNNSPWKIYIHLSKVSFFSWPPLSLCPPPPCTDCS